MASSRPPPASRARSALLLAATRLFADRGYEGAATREIAEAAGTTLSSIPHHFGGKEGLYDGVLARAADVVAARIRSSVAAGAPHDGDPVVAAARILDVVDRLVVLATSDDQRDALTLLLREWLIPHRPRSADRRAALDVASDDLACSIALAAGCCKNRSRLLADTLMGHALAFRTCEALAMRLVGSEGMGGIRPVIRSQARWFAAELLRIEGGLSPADRLEPAGSFRTLDAPRGI